MNYRIVGQDGKTYGPVAADQIREWLAHGRVDRRTPVFVTGAADWTFIGLLPEFAAPATPPTPAALRRDVLPGQKTNGFATAGFVCGMLSLGGFCCCCCFPVSLLGVIFSILAMVQIQASNPPPNGFGLALAGLICSVAGGLVGFFVSLLNGLLGALTDPSVNSLPFKWT
jgi:hypothetical protein